MLLAATSPTQPATQLAVSAPSCLGKWSGQWDDTWDVTFTITQNRDTQKLDVLYQWIENPGRPMRRMKLPATLEGNTLHIERDGGNMIDITFSETDPQLCCRHRPLPQSPHRRADAPATRRGMNR